MNSYQSASSCIKTIFLPPANIFGGSGRFRSASLAELTATPSGKENEIMAARRAGGTCNYSPFMTMRFYLCVTEENSIPGAGELRFHIDLTRKAALILSN